jgi:hypothetical protein
MPDVAILTDSVYRARTELRRFLANVFEPINAPISE